MRSRGPPCADEGGALGGRRPKLTAPPLNPELLCLRPNNSGFNTPPR